MTRGYFISLEGVEGVGKSTAMQHIHTLLTSANLPFISTREPGGTQIAETIRQVVLQHHDESMHEDTELLLMFACRAQNVAQVIKPALKQGQWVLCDRFVDASFAYQGGGRGINLKRIEGLAQWVLEGLKPDLTLLLDAPVEVGFKRIHQRGDKDRIESEGLTFLNKVRNTYLARAEQEPERFRIINANQDLEHVHADITNTITQFIASKA